eukprot:TRINITY_DN3599_c1_g2_i1.p1 TRINITY_DN3599_c1_g2~~TRINITY_DN3599_c1_g2_i1.p1  ORF type:complete len:532 (+),score=68.62 TRINITY_DN3599_c1_g2_i1:87-1682(+)
MHAYILQCLQAQPAIRFKKLILDRMSKAVLIFLTSFEVEIETIKAEFVRVTNLLIWGGIKVAILMQAESCAQVQYTKEVLSQLESFPDDISQLNFRSETLHLVLDMYLIENGLEKQDLLALVGDNKEIINQLNQQKIQTLTFGTKKCELGSLLEVPQRISNDWKRQNRNIVRVGHIMKLSREQDLSKRGFLPIVPIAEIAFFPIIPRLFQNEHVDVILHKATDQLVPSAQPAENPIPRFDPQLENLLSNFTGPVINPLTSVEKVLDRRTISQELSKLNGMELGNGYRVLTPPYFQYDYYRSRIDDEQYENTSSVPWKEVLHARGMQLPLIAKPVVACGINESHHMAIYFDASELGNMRRDAKHINMPVCVTQYYNHGGWVYKVYVAGSQLFVHKRQSLPDFGPENVRSSKVIWFDSLSSLPSELQLNDEQLKLQNQKEAFIDETSESFLEAARIIATYIGKQLGLQLFGFDIVAARDGNTNKQEGEDDQLPVTTLVVVDVNFFPSFKGIPEAPAAVREMVKHVVQPYREAM